MCGIAGYFEKKNFSKMQNTNIAKKKKECYFSKIMELLFFTED